MSKQTVGILVPSDDSMPSMPVQVSGYESVRDFVGGMIDVVRTTVSAHDIGAKDGEDNERFTAVGYVHDEGLLIGLPLNARASVIFGRELVGDVLIVNAENTNGVCDGDNYDVPEWFVERMSDGSLERTITIGRSISQTVVDAMAHCVRAGIYTEQEVAVVVAAMEDAIHGRGTDEDREMVELFLMSCVKYHMMHELGVDLDMVNIVEDVARNGISDDELEKFLQEEGE